MDALWAIETAPFFLRCEMISAPEPSFWQSRSFFEAQFIPGMVNDAKKALENYSALRPRAKLNTVSAAMAAEIAAL